MKLSNIESRKLLPRFASKIAWLMDALDSIIKPISERVKSIDAPLTLEAIAALTDEELEALYDQYGVAQYYPELSRSTRDLMLYEMCKIYRYLGTPHAIELLCNYIFDNVPLNVHVIDNLAFDEHGTLIDATLLDTFDIEVNPNLPVLSVDTTARLLANIIRFSRNSQALRDVIYTFSEDFDLYIYPLNAGIPAQNWENDALCEPVIPPTPGYTEITLYLASNSNEVQKGVTSQYVGAVSGSNAFPLFYDQECTNRFEYDYSSNHEVGEYVDGVWTALRDSISDLPDSTAAAADSVKAYILYDTGELWICSNSSASTAQYDNKSQITVRIYPKAQQHYALYFNYNSLYGNYSLGASRPGYPWPSGSSGNYMAWFASYPVPSLVKFLGSAGNEFLQGGDVGTISISNNSSNALTVTRAGYTGSINVRCAIFTLDKPTLFAWTTPDKTNRTMNSGAVCILYDESGNGIPFDDTCSYTILGVLQATGANCSGERGVIQYAAMVSYSSVLAFKQTYGSVSAAKIWYIKTPIS